jgi:hypothetical protein
MGDMRKWTCAKARLHQTRTERVAPGCYEDDAARQPDKLFPARARTCGVYPRNKLHGLAEVGGPGLAYTAGPIGRPLFPGSIRLIGGAKAPRVVRVTDGLLAGP